MHIQQAWILLNFVRKILCRPLLCILCGIIRPLPWAGRDADIAGFSSEAIQMAADALKETGGTIVLSPGTYDIQAPVKLYSNTTLIGSGTKTVLKKCKGFRSKFILDADYGELQLTVSDVSGFRPGMGIAVFDDDRRHNWDVTTARITAIEGNKLYIDTYLVRDYLAEKTESFPMPVRLLKQWKRKISG